MNSWLLLQTMLNSGSKEMSPLVLGLYRQQCSQVLMAAGSTLPGHSVFLISDHLWPRDIDCSLENLFGVMAPLPQQLQWVM